MTRSAIANERLTLNNGAGQVVLMLKTPYRDGDTHIVISPLEFVQHLAAERWFIFPGSAINETQNSALILYRCCHK
ncbi:hypothetical protein [Candidatus Nitrotoga sp. M5]|uniref:hypothetical protein n=1 Tax=Candidatus Nitrotoga sp. M5 TaxID=2890409 RepID=UPI00403DA41C